MLVQQKPTKLSRAQLEVLSIIAYRQPVTRPEVDDVRGVDSGSALKLLLERNLIKIIGKKDEAGRPMLYATTTDFLELFGLKNLRDLPTLREFTELTQESRDIFERRIGEPLPGQGQGMDLQTHFDAEGRPVEPEEPDEPTGNDAEAEGAKASDDDGLADDAARDDDFDDDLNDAPSAGTDAEPRDQDDDQEPRDG
jgi:segregation and condensation protein B